MKPATPLPWVIGMREGMAAAMYGVNISSEHFNRPGVVDGRGSVAEVRGPVTVEQAAENAAYIVHAANAYPELVAALRDLLSNGQAIRRGFCEPNPYRKNSESYRDWESSASENADIFDTTEKTARALLAKLGEG